MHSRCCAAITTVWFRDPVTTPRRNHTRSAVPPAPSPRQPVLCFPVSLDLCALASHRPTHLCFWAHPCCSFHRLCKAARSRNRLRHTAAAGGRPQAQGSGPPGPVKASEASAAVWGFQENFALAPSSRTPASGGEAACSLAEGAQPSGHQSTWPDLPPSPAHGGPDAHPVGPEHMPFDNRVLGALGKRCNGKPTSRKPPE